MPAYMFGKFCVSRIAFLSSNAYWQAGSQWNGTCPVMSVVSGTRTWCARHPWPHGFVKADSSQEASDLLLVSTSRRGTHIEQGIDLFFHWLARRGCHLVPKEVGLFDSPIALEGIGLRAALCYPLQDLFHYLQVFIKCSTRPNS